MSELGIPLEHRMIDVGGVRLHTVLAGDPDAPLVVLLHGFPQLWWAFRHQIPALVAAGYRVAAPDQRGYNLSDKPRGVSAYDINELVTDVEGLRAALGAERMSLLGHDWGGMVAWWYAMRYPQRLDRLIVLSLPHPKRFQEAMRTARQLTMSWYVFAFQIPGLPERAFPAHDWALLRLILERDPVRPAFDGEDVDRHVQALSRPGALRSSVAWYRAAVRMWATRRVPPMRRIDTPTLVLWGAQERYLHPDFAAPPPELVPHARVEIWPDASHWLLAEHPERVAERLLEFLPAPRPLAGLGPP